MLDGSGWIACPLDRSLELIHGPDGVEVKPKFEPDKLGIGRNIIIPWGNVIDRDITWVNHVGLR